MSVTIKKDKCISCGKCIEVCPGNLIKRDEDKKAYIKYPKDCWGCTSCLKECDMGAVVFFLGADIGGLGSTLSYGEKDSIVTWRVNSPDGTYKEIKVDRTQSNQY